MEISCRTRVDNILNDNTLNEALIREGDKLYQGMSLKGKNGIIKFGDFKSLNGDFYWLFGSIDRNDVVDCLSELVNRDDEFLENFYRQDKHRNSKDEIAWFSFKTDDKGKYIEYSFKLSPMLWTITQIRNSKKNNLCLKKESYDKTNDFYNNFLTNGKTYRDSSEETKYYDIPAERYLELYNKVDDIYVKPNFYCNYSNDRSGKLIYRRFKENVKVSVEDLKDYAMLSGGFFAEDFSLFYDMVKSENFGNNNEYEKSVIDYILSCSDENKQKNRIIISSKEPKEKMKKFFSDILSVSNSPMGKWPCRYTPSLMQQVAINIAIKKESQDGYVPIFSVNGPPGTGKTTLLKEIIAHNIVERANLLAVYEEPDEAFIEHGFKDGLGGNGYYSRYAQHYYSLKNDKINDYSMLVASNNNKAVENITKELPNFGKLDAVDEIKDLFDKEKSEDTYVHEKDVYFTKLACDRFEENNCWGLVSVPLGKRENIDKYSKILECLYYNYSSKSKNREEYIKIYKKTRNDFLKQYEKVVEERKNLEKIINVKGYSFDHLKSCENYYVSELNQVEIELQKEQGIIDGIKLKLSKLNSECNKTNNEINALNQKLEEITPCIFFRFIHKKEVKELKGKIKNKENELGILNRKRIEFETEWRKKEDNLKNIQKKRIEYRGKLQYYGDITNFKKSCERNPELKGLIIVDDDFMDDYTSENNDKSTKAQIENPYTIEKYNREREKLFYCAVKLHRDFVISSKCMKENIANIRIAWSNDQSCKEKMSSNDKDACMPYLFQSLFLFTPVISTTFASVGKMFKNVKECGAFGNLIIDEAGQAQPHMAVGAMLRCRKAIVVGDPKQVDPVVKPEEKIVNKILAGEGFLREYCRSELSVQEFADTVNPYGTYLEDDWVGCPLVVHRRCIDPMFSISNRLSYDNTMKIQTKKPSNEKKFVLDKSYWIDVDGKEIGSKNHFVKEQGEVVLKLLKKKFGEDDTSKLFVISPFKTVKNEMKDMIESSDLYQNNQRVKKWLKNDNIGTVHTFQGQEADEVIFLLGCDKSAMGAIRFVNKNIVNVAVTRAKYRLYIVGDKKVWENNDSLEVAVNILDNCTITSKELDDKLGVSDLSESIDIFTVQNLTNKNSGVGLNMTKEMPKQTKESSKCPLCGKGYQVEKTNSKNGKKFLGCSLYRKTGCKWTESINE